jgi:hypothetical protein
MSQPVSKLLCVICWSLDYSEPTLYRHLRLSHSTGRVVHALVQLTMEMRREQLERGHLSIQRPRGTVWFDASTHDTATCLLCQKQAALAKAET